MNLPAIKTATILVVLLSHFTMTLAAAGSPLKETVVYKKAGDLAIRADVVYYPDEDPRPVIVSLHGGALIMGHRESISSSVRSFAATNKCALVSFDYRLAPETKLPEIIKDIEDAFRWLHREAGRYHFDTSRICVTGGSAGGYLSLLTGHRIRPRPQVLLAYFGYGDLIGDWYAKPSAFPRHNPRPITAEEAWQQVKGPPISDARERKGDGGIFYNFCRQTGSWPKAVSNWDPQQEAAKFFPYMPLKSVTPEFPPTVLIHGTADTDVPFEQSKLMADELKKHGVPYQLHTIEGAEHGLGGADRAKLEKAQAAAFDFVKGRLRLE